MSTTSAPASTGRQTWNIIGAFLGICTGLVAMGSFEAMLVPIQDTFVFSVDDVNVLALAVSTGSLLILFVAGSMVDRWGARRVLTIGVVAMITGALIVATAVGFGWLLIGRFVGGIGGMTMSVACLATLNASFVGDRKRAHIFGLLAAAMGGAALLAPVVGGSIAERASWRIVPIIWIVVATLTLFLLRGSMLEQPHATASQELLTPLAAGVVLSSLCLSALLIGTSKSSAAIALAVSVLAFIAILVQWRRLRGAGISPGLNITMFKSRGALLLIGAMLFVGAVNLFFYGTLFLQYRLGMTPSGAARTLIVPQLAVIAGGLLGGWIGGKIGSLRTTAIALGLGSLAALTFMFISETSGAGMFDVILAAFALPTGCILGSLTKSFLDRADPDASGAASSWRQGTWTLGSTLGGVTTGFIVFNFFSRSWQEALQRDGIAQDIAAFAAESVRGGVSLVELATTPGMEDLRVDSAVKTLLDLTTAQVETFKLVSVLAAVSYAIALVFVLAAMWRTRVNSHG